VFVHSHASLRVLHSLSPVLHSLSPMLRVLTATVVSICMPLPTRIRSLHRAARTRFACWGRSVRLSWRTPPRRGAFICLPRPPPRVGRLHCVGCLHPLSWPPPPHQFATLPVPCALKTRVANVCSSSDVSEARCKCFHMDAVEVDPDVAHVAMAIHIYMFQEFVLNVSYFSVVCCKCFI
jgi:hypothetical protein